MKYKAILGNVEVEASNASADWWGCGCAYPMYVSDEVVGRSDAIVADLRKIALTPSDENTSVLQWYETSIDKHIHDALFYHIASSIYALFLI